MGVENAIEETEVGEVMGKIRVGGCHGEKMGVGGCHAVFGEKDRRGKKRSGGVCSRFFTTAFGG